MMRTLILNKKINSFLYLCKPIVIQISKRFYPTDKKIGHAKKLLDHRSMSFSKRISNPQCRKLRQQCKQHHNKYITDTKIQTRHRGLSNRELQGIRSPLSSKKFKEVNNIDMKNPFQNSQKVSEPFSPLTSITKTCKTTFKSFIKKDSLSIASNQIPLPESINNTISHENQNINLSDPTFPIPPLHFGITNDTQHTPSTTVLNDFSKIDNTSSSVKPIPELKNPDGVIYTTNITEKTSMEELTKQQLIDELKKRNLIKITKSPAVIIETESDGHIRIGNKDNDLIFTKHGRAYLELQPKSQIFINPLEITKENITLDDLNNFCIIVPKNYEDDLIKASPHMIAAYDPTNTHLYAFSTFTSEKVGLKVSDEQFKKFQMKKQGIVFTKEEELKPHNNKSQQLRFFKNIQVLDKNEAYVAKFDQDYFFTMSLNVKKDLVDNYNNLKTKHYEKYMPQTISNEQLLNMCKDVDKEAQKKKPKHPMTLEQQQKKEVEKQKNQLFQLQNKK
uniref:Uncharacterized protein n=1 Tax=Physarum polycephalum TaxID=5791 RepID=Q9MJ76_PHYPO|nr:hypothetical protein PhpooMp07 [Physarum polycephalum]BAB08086.1 unnamed protein product [Physarum polycephalum]